MFPVIGVFMCISINLLLISVGSSEHDSLDLSRHLQPDNIGQAVEDDTSRSGRAINNYRCDRACEDGDAPRICYYRFTVEEYHTQGQACGNCPSNRTACYDPQCVTVDGYERGVLTVNRRIPGPSIQVCVGDRIVVDVKNVMLGRTTTIHWHGIYQTNSQYMDGVPMVTQCPIDEGTVFRYDFIADNVGTHFWHSHDGLQKMDGIMGSLIVREPWKKDPNFRLYDHDLRSHVMLLADWMHEDANQKFPGFRRRDVGQHPDTFLINGKGRFTPTPHFPPFSSILPPLPSFFGRPLGMSFPSKTPYAVFRVISGERFRFRVIGGMCLVCPVQVSVEKHKLQVIAADGTPIEPVQADRIVLLAGERYDFVLKANQKASSYWIHIKGLGSCEQLKTHQVAILNYLGSPHEEPPSSPPGPAGFQVSNAITLNPLDVNCGAGSSGICVDQLMSVEPVPAKLMTRDPELRLVIGFGFHAFSKKQLFQTNTYHRFFQPPVPMLVGAMINNITNVLGPSPLLSQYHDIPKEAFCADGDNGKTGCKELYCECLQVMKIPLGAMVEIVFADESPLPNGLTHPFHLHGHDFRVMSTGLFTAQQNVRNFLHQLSSGRLQLPRNSLAYRAPTAKDTIAVPSAGYAVVRFLADNPGFWMLHCHFIFHTVTGMNVIIQIGEESDIPHVPEGFPKCGSFLPTVHMSPEFV